MSQNWMNHPLSLVGKKGALVGSLSSSTLLIRPMCMKPVKKMTVRGVP